jgi:surface polysaccharide O-acyltransferase-like enzyme
MLDRVGFARLGRNTSLEGTSTQLVHAPEMRATRGRADAAERVESLDALRALAVLAVVQIHVAETVLFAQSATEPGAWFSAHVYDSFSRWCVPVFVIISGYFLLSPKQEESAGQFYRRRLAKIGWPLLFWATLFSALALPPDARNLEHLVTKILSGRPWYHLWYLYMYLGLVLFVPALRSLLARCSTAQIWAVAGTLLFGTTGICFAGSFGWIEYDICALSETPFPFWFVGYLGYFVTGAALRRTQLPKAPKRIAFLVFLGTGALTVVGTDALLRHTTNGGGFYFYHYLSPPALVMALALFLIMRRGIEFFPGKIVQQMAQASLGIYIVHPLFISAFERLGLNASILHPVVAIPMLSGLVAAISWAAVALMSRIPCLRRVV